MQHQTVDITKEKTELDHDLVLRLVTVAGLVGAGALLIALVVAAIFGQWETFLKSYLHNFVFVVSLSLGGLFFVFIQHLTRAGWSVTVRRMAEVIASNFIWLPILFIPILLSLFLGGGDLLFPWVRIDNLPASEQGLIEGKVGYLNVTFFIIRALIYFAVWAFLSVYLYNKSVQQDKTGDVGLTRRMQWWSAPAAPLFAFTLTFASIDWMMSLNPGWFSTMFGVYFFAGACTGIFSLLAIGAIALQKNGRLTNAINAEHYQDIGKFLFAFGMVFWAYIAFSQYMLIWYASIPEETSFFMARQIGGWRILSLFLLLGHFVIPFVLLISRHTKRYMPVLLFVACWMLLFHWLDLYWLIMPVMPHDLHEFDTYPALVRAYEDMPVGWSIFDLLCLVGLGGVYLAITAYRLQGRSLLCLRDPRLNESLTFENV